MRAEQALRETAVISDARGPVWANAVAALVVVAPLVAWALHFVVVYSLAGLGCEDGWQLRRVAGVDALTLALMDQQTVQQTPTYTLTKSDGRTTARPGDQLSYTITLTNTSNTAAQNIVVIRAELGTAGAIDRLRTFAELPPDAKPRAVALAATDPANPYGAALPWPERDSTGGHRHSPHVCWAVQNAIHGCGTNNDASYRL